MKDATGEVVAFGIFQAKLGKADDLMDLLSEELNLTLRTEGVKDAYISQSLEEPNHFFSYSRWESVAAYDRMQEEYSSRQEEDPGLFDLLEAAPLWGNYIVIE
jgi:quinol monooxygenase YgiN